MIEILQVLFSIPKLLDCEGKREQKQEVQRVNFISSGNAHD
jgi:hypothetical protein